MNRMKKAVTVMLVISVVLTGECGAQHVPEGATREEVMQGSITPARAWWDLTYYELRVKVLPDEKFLSGSTAVFYEVLTPHQTLQIDLQPPLKVLRVVQDGQELGYKKDGDNAYLIALEKPQVAGAKESLVVYYEGKPREARRAPWDGGLSWKRDKNNQHFIGTSCQGLGASVWWPCKDHAYDEPDSMLISVTVPAPLMDISNGRLRRMSIDEKAGTRTFDWFVTNPINNYGVNLNIGDYARFSEIYEGERGKLDMDYYVLSYNLETARAHFGADATRMMKAFEHWFGPYPFYEDGYKIVETPYLGMEHQSSVTYGNNYKKGYLGKDLSGTGHGMGWDYIIIHESGHEWFANNVTYKDIADMWVHEGFTTYSEGLFTEYHYGKQAGAEYIVGLRQNISNDQPIIGTYGLNKRGSNDMYYKGANMLHTIRQIVDNDELWRQILRGINREFYHQTVTTEQIEGYMIQQSGKPLQKVFDQYLRQADLPVLEWEKQGKTIRYRWTNCAAGFEMPLRAKLNGKSDTWLQVTTEWSEARGTGLEVDPNFYVEVAERKK